MPQVRSTANKVDLGVVAVPVSEGIVDAHQAGEDIEEQVEKQRAAGEI
jgi:hypothetical protein